MHYRQKSNGMYILSRSDIEQIATQKLQEYSPLSLESPTPLKTTDFLEDHLGLLIKYRYICDFKSGILGLTVMSDEIPIPSYDEMFHRVVLEETFGTVLITPMLMGRENIPRRRYTEMHEAAHFILHQPYFRQCEQSIATRSEYPRTFVACRQIEIHNERPKTDVDWLEYQADALAAAMLMPRDVFSSYVCDLLRKNGIRNNHIYAGPYTDKRKVHSIIYDVADTFLVSYQAAKIRMLHLGLLTE